MRTRFAHRRALVVIEFATTRYCKWRFMEMTDEKKKGMGWACVGAGEYPRLDSGEIAPPEEVRLLRLLEKVPPLPLPRRRSPPSRESDTPSIFSGRFQKNRKSNRGIVRPFPDRLLNVWYTAQSDSALKNIGTSPSIFYLNRIGARFAARSTSSR